MLGLGTTELLIFLAIILILFGKRIPGAMRSLGAGLREFKTGLKDPGDDPDAMVKS
jgi:sec-independent protein translocase protein TatA